MAANDFDRKRPKHLYFEQTDFFSPGTKFGQNQATGAGDRAGGDDNNLGILAADRFYL